MGKSEKKLDESLKKKVIGSMKRKRLDNVMVPVIVTVVISLVLSQVVYLEFRRGGDFFGLLTVIHPPPAMMESFWGVVALCLGWGVLIVSLVAPPVMAYLIGYCLYILYKWTPSEEDIQKYLPKYIASLESLKKSKRKSIQWRKARIKEEKKGIEKAKEEILATEAEIEALEAMRKITED